jgi:hypothetical protein
LRSFEAVSLFLHLLLFDHQLQILSSSLIR